MAAARDVAAGVQSGDGEATQCAKIIVQATQAGVDRAGRAHDGEHARVFRAVFAGVTYGTQEQRRDVVFRADERNAFAGPGQAPDQAGPFPGRGGVGRRPQSVRAPGLASYNLNREADVRGRRFYCPVLPA